MGLFGKIATLAAVALPGKAIAAASRGKTSTSAAAGTPPPPPPPPPAAGGVKAKTGAGGPGPGSIGGIAAPGGQVQGQGRQSSMNAFRAGQPPAPPSGSGGMSIWEAGSKSRAKKTEL